MEQSNAALDALLPTLVRLSAFDFDAVAAQLAKPAMTRLWGLPPSLHAADVLPAGVCRVLWAARAKKKGRAARARRKPRAKPVAVSPPPSAPAAAPAVDVSAEPVVPSGFNIFKDSLKEQNEALYSSLRTALPSVGDALPDMGDEEGEDGAGGDGDGSDDDAPIKPYVVPAAFSTLGSDGRGMAEELEAESAALEGLEAHLRVLNMLSTRDALRMSSDDEENVKRLRSFAATQPGCASLSSKVQAIASAGGRVVFAPSEAEMAKWPVDERPPWQAGIRASDLLLPVSEIGINRAQVLHVVLRGLMGRLAGDRSRVVLPHGAVSGYDPWTAYERLNAGNFVDYTHVDAEEMFQADWLTRMFKETFGVEKAPRFGSELGKTLELEPERMDAGQWKRLEEARGSMRNHFDAAYYSSTATGRRIFLVCGAALPVVLDRLLEQAQPLKETIIVAFPFADELAASGSSEAVKMAHAAGDELASRDSLCRAAHEALYAQFARLLCAVRLDMEPPATSEELAASRGKVFGSVLSALGGGDAAGETEEVKEAAADGGDAFDAMLVSMEAELPTDAAPSSELKELFDLLGTADDTGGGEEESKHGSSDAPVVFELPSSVGDAGDDDDDDVEEDWRASRAAMKRGGGGRGGRGGRGGGRGGRHGRMVIARDTASDEEGSDEDIEDDWRATRAAMKRGGRPAAPVSSPSSSSKRKSALEAYRLAEQERLAEMEAKQAAAAEKAAARRKARVDAARSREESSGMFMEDADAPPASDPDARSLSSLDASSALEESKTGASSPSPPATSPSPLATSPSPSPSPSPSGGVEESKSAASSSSPTRAKLEQALLAAGAPETLFDRELSFTQQPPALPPALWEQLCAGQPPSPAVAHSCCVLAIRDVDAILQAELLAWLLSGSTGDAMLPFSVIGLCQTATAAPVEQPSLLPPLAGEAQRLTLVAVESGRAGGSAADDVAAFLSSDARLPSAAATPLSELAFVVQQLAASDEHPLALLARPAAFYPLLPPPVAGAGTLTDRAQASALLPAAEMTVMTLKADVLTRVDALADVLARIAVEGLSLAGIRMLYVSGDDLSLAGLPSAVLPDGGDKHGRRPVVAVAIRGHNALATWLSAVGASDPALARRTDGGTSLRARWGRSRRANLCDLARRRADADRQLLFWFGGRLPATPTPPAPQPPPAFMLQARAPQLALLFLPSDAEQALLGMTVTRITAAGFALLGMARLALDSLPAHAGVPSSLSLDGCPVTVLLLLQEGAVAHVASLQARCLGDSWAAATVDDVARLLPAVLPLLTAVPPPEARAEPLDASAFHVDDQLDATVLVALTAESLRPPVCVGNLLSCLLALPEAEEDGRPPADEPLQLLAMKLLPSLPEEAAAVLRAAGASGGCPLPASELASQLAAGDTLLLVLRGVRAAARLHGALQDDGLALASCAVVVSSPPLAYAAISHLFAASELLPGAPPPSGWLSPPPDGTLRGYFPAQPQPLLAALVVKPDAMSRRLLAKVVRRLEREGFLILSLAVRALEEAEAVALCSSLPLDEQAFNDSVAHLTSAAAGLLLLRRADGVRALSRIVGPADPAVARRLAEFSLRANFGRSVVCNAFHAPASWEESLREVRILFPDMPRDAAFSPRLALPWYASDVGGAAAAGRLFTRAAGTLAETTALLLLPGVFAEEGGLADVLKALEAERFSIVAGRTMWLTAEQASELAAVLPDQLSTSRACMASVTGGRSVALALHRDNACARLQTVLHGGLAASYGDGKQMLCSTASAVVKTLMEFFFDGVAGAGEDTLLPRPPSPSPVSPVLMTAARELGSDAPGSATAAALLAVLPDRAAVDVADVDISFGGGGGGGGGGGSSDDYGWEEGKRELD